MSKNLLVKFESEFFDNILSAVRNKTTRGNREMVPLKIICSNNLSNLPGKLIYTGLFESGK